MFSGKYREIFAPSETVRKGPKAKPEVPPGRFPDISIEISYGIFLKT